MVVSVTIEDPIGQTASMKNLLSILSVGSLALVLSSCGSEQASQTPPVAQQNPAPAAAPSPAPAAAPATTTRTNPVSGMIPSTDPAKLTPRIDRGRNDPTAIIPLTPIVTVVPQPPGQTAAAPTAPTSPAGGSSGGAVPPVPPVATAPQSPPGPPQPNEARGVQVTAIVQLPTTPMAIIKAPGERTERRVVPGSLLSNGLVKVQSIDTNVDNPSITLVQYGQTVRRRLGDGLPAEPSRQAVIIFDGTIQKEG